MLVTASWRALWEAWKVGRLTVTPVRVSLGLPKFWPAAELYPTVESVTPSGWMRSVSGDQFRKAYRSKLDRIGITSIHAHLAAIETTQPLALACFEADPTDCHRGLLGEWWFEKTGRAIPEWMPRFPVQIDAEYKPEHES